MHSGYFFKRLVVLSSIICLTSISVFTAEPLPWPAPIPGWQPIAPGEHPRLFFRKSDLPALKERALTPQGKQIIEYLKKSLGGGESMPTVYNTRPPVNILPWEKEIPFGSFTLFHGAGFGFLYQLTGDIKYADLARQCVDKVLTNQVDRDQRYCWKTPGAGLRAGMALSSVALAYDLCYDAWSAEYRRSICDSIINFSALPVDNEGFKPPLTLDTMALAPWHNPASNHYGNFCGGAGIACLAVKGDPGVNNTHIDSLMQGVDRSTHYALRNAWGDYGYFAENQGPSHMFTYPVFLSYLQACKTAAGKDYFVNKTNASYISLLMIMELMIGPSNKPYIPVRPNGNVYGYENILQPMNGPWTNPSVSQITFAQCFGVIPHKFKRAMLWCYDSIIKPAEGGNYMIGAYPHRAILALVNWPIGETAQNPAEVFPKVLFDSRFGYVCFRNRWQDNKDILVTLLCGSEGHNLSYSGIKVEKIAVWGLGMRLEFPGIFNKHWPTLVDGREDGSGVMSAVSMNETSAKIVNNEMKYFALDNATVNSFAVDYSKASGAEVLCVMTGPMAGLNTSRKPATLGDVSGTGATARKSKHTVGSDTFYVMTLQTGTPPTPRVEGNKLIVGNQIVTFDKKRLHLSVMNPVQIINTNSVSVKNVNVYRHWLNREYKKDAVSYNLRGAVVSKRGQTDFHKRFSGVYILKNGNKVKVSAEIQR